MWRHEVKAWIAPVCDGLACVHVSLWAAMRMLVCLSVPRSVRHVRLQLWWSGLGLALCGVGWLAPLWCGLRVCAAVCAACAHICLGSAMAVPWQCHGDFRFSVSEVFFEIGILGSGLCDLGVGSFFVPVLVVGSFSSGLQEYNN